MNKYLTLGLLTLILVGCQDRYRYPCQDPANIHKEECSEEACKLTNECPKYGK